MNHVYGLAVSATGMFVFGHIWFPQMAELLTNVARMIPS